MLLTWLAAVAALLVLLGGWVAVQTIARKFAERHPKAGPFRTAGGGCGGGCSGCGTHCDSGDGAR